MKNKRYKLYSLLCVCLLLFSFGQVQGQTAVPGGATNTTFIAWLTPDSYNNGTWTNLITTAASVGNFGGAQANPGKPATTGNGEYNFHQAVVFDKTAPAAAPNQLFSANRHNISGTDNVTSIFVLQRKTTDVYDGIIGYASTDNYNSISWRGAGNNDLTHTWTGTNVNMGAVQNGILVVDNSNVAANAAAEGLRVYKNGVKSAFASYAWNGTTNAGTGIVALGGGRNGQMWYGYQGNIQEVILIKNSGNGHMNPTDLIKIQSYLAIKYGITLNNSDNYLNSDGQTVWDRTVNSGYSSAIAGLARDDASGLYQKQAMSADNSTLSIFLGSSLQTWNKDNTETLPDKTYAIFGASGFKGNNYYNYNAGTAFANGSIAEPLNYMTANVYKAQITTNGAASSQTISIKTSYFFADYVLVSANSNFTPGSTRIYPIVNQIASNVVVNDGECLALAGFTPTPGGLDITGSPYMLDLWVSGNNSSNTTWENLTTANYSLVKFAANNNTPIVRPSRFNYHNEIYFGNTGSSKLATSIPYAMTPNNSYYVFAVSDAVNQGSSVGTVFTFGGAQNTSFRWESALTNLVSAYWTTTQRSTNFNLNTDPLHKRYGITTLNVVNVNNSSMDIYLNGIRATFSLGATANTSGAANHTLTDTYRMFVGDANVATGTTSSNHFKGAIQELIVMRRVGTQLMSDADIAKVHSYLAIKYGITLRNTNYVNTAGTIVWNTSTNAGYNNDIFGLARDESSGIYQRQAHNVNSPNMIAYLGNSIAASNVQNTGTLADMQYMLIGSSGGTIVQTLTGINDGDVFANGTVASDNGFNIQSPVYKTQITGPASSLTVRLNAPSNDFIYVLVSPNSLFNPSTTQIFALDGRTVQLTLNNGEFFKFIGFSPGPGGVNPNLVMWLRADDDASITINNLSTSDPKLGGTGALGTAAPYPDRVTDPDAVPGVSEWKDLVRNQNYTYAAGNQGNEHFMPVYQKNSPIMNYHPTVRFWGNGQTTNGNGAYLSQQKGIMSTPYPANGQHTAYFIVNNRFGANSFVYPMSISDVTGANGCKVGGATGVSGAGTYPQPGWGVNQQNFTSGGVTVSGVAARFRAGGPELNGTKNLFTPGATSLLGYRTINAPTTGATNNIYYRVNGTEDISNTRFDWNQVHFERPSILGSGPINFSRLIQGYLSEAIIFDRALTDSERDKIESYLAFKYGITLHPTNNTYERANYVLSDGTVLWAGNNPSGNRFADYYNNVAAVVRDDAARLDNPQSHSTDVGTILHLGVAGTVMSDDGAGLGTLNNMEAVSFGCNAQTGNTAIETDDCGAFTNRFNRKWLIHKHTDDNRPISMLVGAQNNMSFNYGENADAATQAYYSVLGEGYNVTLLVGKTPADLDNGNYTASVPMTFVNGEHQCSYVFTDEDTYITFGYRSNKLGCVGDEEAQFTGTKTFKWTDWTSRTNTLNITTARTITVVPTASTGQLGDNIEVTSTRVQFPAGVTAVRTYPRVINTPVNGSLLIERRGGPVGAEVVITIDFNHPVIPEFTISDLDSYASSYEEVEISGTCSGGTFLPVLSYCADQRTSSYKISGNRASVNRTMSCSSTNKNGMVKVAFEGGVSTITIRYRTTNRNTSIIRNIYISPITVRPVPPPTPLNEDGLSFAKQVQFRQLTTCEHVEYSFYIQNTNCAPKPVNFRDILPNANMTWLANSVGVDGYSAELNPELNTNSYGNTTNLEVNNLIIPGASTLVLNATAVFDRDAPSGDYNNQAVINYDMIINDITVNKTWNSVDREDPTNPLTSLYAEWQQRMDSVKVTAAYSADSYSENSIITVAYTIENPNGIDFTDMFFDIEFSDGFTYVDNSFNVVTSLDNSVPPIKVSQDNTEAGALLIAGSTDGFDGFTIPNGRTIISFQIKAPTKEQLPYEVDENGIPTGEVMPLLVGYATFSTAMDDPCITSALVGVTEEFWDIPYKGGKLRIISNKNVTGKIKK
ncbi:MAG: hypothetical protein FWF72_05740 [Paludibacter sp.]|nr:hypothetical protein [Paludibacter sp.]